jgi:hypothetical protein
MPSEKDMSSAYIRRTWLGLQFALWIAGSGRGQLPVAVAHRVSRRDWQGGEGVRMALGETGGYLSKDVFLAVEYA